MIDYKKCLILGLVLAAIEVAPLSVNASEPNLFDLKTMKGYQATLIPDEATALTLYQRMPVRDFKGNSGCFQRAHQWAYDFYKNYNIYSMKVFLFFTARYQREFDYDWFYHVAPLIYVQTEAGPVAKVFDPTFTSAPSWATAEEARQYDNKPVSISEWVKYFVIPEGECPLVENYADYENAQERFYCYTMIAPMYTYIPSNMEVEPGVRNAWNAEDLKQMIKALPVSKR